MKAPVITVVKYFCLLKCSKSEKSFGYLHEQNMDWSLRGMSWI